MTETQFSVDMGVTLLEVLKLYAAWRDAFSALISEAPVRWFSSLEAGACSG